MEITPVHGNPPALVVRDAKGTTLTFDAFYRFSEKEYESQQGEAGEFDELPRHIQKNAGKLLNKKFKTYAIINVDPLSKSPVRGGGTIAFYGKLERSDLKPGGLVSNKKSGAVGIVLGGKDGKLKEPCNRQQVIVRCNISKGINKGKYRYSYWVLENVEQY